jgi:N-acetyl-anhydromuramyl-L-alanine amidase AmpD
MTGWFDWIQNEKLRAAADLTVNGGKLDAQQANETLDLLVAESEFHIRKLVGDKAYEKYFPTNRTGGNWKAGCPIGLVDHYTAGIKASGTLLWFSKRERETPGTSSAQYILDRDGVLMQLIDPRTTIAWHARGDSHTHIGIEHVNAGLLSKSGGGFLYMEQHKYPQDRAPTVQELDGKYWEPYTSRQLMTNMVLKRWLIQAIPTLQKEHFVDHQMLDPARKVDCGPLWPLKSLNALVFSWKPLQGFTSLEPTYMTKNAIAVFNGEVSDLLAS